MHYTASHLQELEKNVINDTFFPRKILISYANECLQKPLEIVLKHVACYKTRQFKLTLISPNWIIVMITIVQKVVYAVHTHPHHHSYYHVFARNRCEIQSKVAKITEKHVAAMGKIVTFRDLFLCRATLTAD